MSLVNSFGKLVWKTRLVMIFVEFCTAENLRSFVVKRVFYIGELDWCNSLLSFLMCRNKSLKKTRRNLPASIPGSLLYMSFSFAFSVRTLSNMSLDMSLHKCLVCARIYKNYDFLEQFLEIDPSRTIRNGCVFDQFSDRFWQNLAEIKFF